MRVNCARLAASALLLASACSRTGLWGLVPPTDESSSGGGTGSPNRATCVEDSDCPVVDPCAPPVCVPRSSGNVSDCVAQPLDCDDGDACTFDRCAADLGVCEHEAPVDLDGDGYIGVAPAGAPATCGGGDCDDEDRAVHPGATESCNGEDDDCDGAIDEGAAYRVASAPVELAPGMGRSVLHGGIVWNGSAYGVMYTTSSESSHKKSYFVLLDANGQRPRDPALVSDLNADTYAGSVAWSGQSFLATWSDARQAGNYEIYATRFDASAQKLSADERLTNAPDYSLRPITGYSGSQYLMIWEDRRFEASSGTRGVYGLRVSAGGALLGSEIPLTSPDELADFGTLAIGDERVGVAYLVTNVDNSASVRFRSFDQSFADGTGPVDLGSDAQDPSLVHARGRFLVAWNTGRAGPGFGSQIQAALVDANGATIAARAVTSGDALARWKTLVSLGDHALLIWSGAGAEGAYALHFETLSIDDLSTISERQLLQTSSRGGLLQDPVAVRGPQGDIGVLYDDNRSAIVVSYFIRLTCRPDP